MGESGVGITRLNDEKPVFLRNRNGLFKEIEDIKTWMVSERKPTRS
ncbi:MAG: hypothetical protein LBJ91_03870 [Clostridiales Family XIII bacterium]|nr:hypothetical protein [Clostridiales Family XIII bacterium]